MDLTEFTDIAPFNDEETDAALSRLANHPNTPWISRYIFPDKPASFLAELLRSIHTVDDFQQLIMSKAIRWTGAYPSAEREVPGHVQPPGYHPGSGHHAGGSHEEQSAAHRNLCWR